MAGCQFAGCDERDRLRFVRHVPTDLVRTYCDDHCPEIDGETWEDFDG